MKRSQDRCDVHVKPVFWRAVANLIAKRAYRLFHIEQRGGANLPSNQD
jgi:hypothetical protein